MSTEPDAGVDAGPPTPPEPVVEDYAAPSGKLPIALTFKTADDLNKNFAVVGEIAQSADSEGVLKVAKGKTALITYDTTPDKERTNTFESFTATIKFHSEKPVHLWVAFATDKNRNDGQTIGFGMENGKPGPPGVSDVDNIFYGQKCWAVSLFGKGSQCASQAESYGWTAWEPSSQPQSVKITVKADKTAKSIKARAEFIDVAGDVIDGSNYEWSGLNRVNGELSFGLNATLSDGFIDEINVKDAEVVPEDGIIRTDEGDTRIHAWIPRNLKATDKVKGLIITDPDLSQPANGTGDFALFEHLRKFATAHGWALIGGVRAAPKDFAKYFVEDMNKLKTKAARPEFDTVPVFVHSLLDLFPYQALSDASFNKRIIGFFADKPRTGGDINAGTAEKYADYPQSAYSRTIPGFIAFSTVSAITGRGVMYEFWGPNRFFEEVPGMMKTDGFAHWALVSHGPQTNAVVDSWMLYLAQLQDLIKMRTNGNDGGALKPVDRSKGYLGKSDFFTTMPAGDVSLIEPFATKGFEPPPAVIDTPVKLARIRNPQQDFLYSDATALVWQAFDYWKSHKGMNEAGAKIDIFDAKMVWWANSPKHGRPMDSRKLSIAFDEKLKEWKTIEFFDSASVTPMVPLAKINAGATPEYEYKNLAQGAHNFVAKLTMGDGKIHMTHPVMAIFAP